MKPNFKQFLNVIPVAIVFLFSSSFVLNNEIIKGKEILKELHKPSFAEALNYKVNRIAIETAITGYNHLVANGGNFKENIIVIDYSKSANEERFYVVNVKDSTLLYSTLVAHGRNTGELFATEFSNTIGSFKSSLGFFRTAEAYDGKHGLSLRLDGLESGINDNARERAIVIHSADYVSQEFISENGRLGRSLGCPALSKENYNEVIELIQGGCLLFIHGNHDEYVHRSALLANS